MLIKSGTYGILHEIERARRPKDEGRQVLGAKPINNCKGNEQNHHLAWENIEQVTPS